MDTYLQQIKDFIGAEELYQLLSRWDRLAERLERSDEKTRNSIGPLCRILPDMLWLSPPASGKTPLLHLLAEHLNVIHAVDFTGNVKYLEVFLNYHEPSVPFSSFQMLMENVRHAAGFRPQFKGVVHIDIEEWAGHEDEAYFHMFMEYLADHSDEWMIVLSMTGRDEKRFEHLKAVACSYLRLEQVRLRYPKENEMLAMVKDDLSACGLELSEDAVKLLKDTVRTLRSCEYFDGLKSIRMLAKDIAYQCLSDPGEGSPLVTAEQLSVFSKDSEYVKRQMKSLEDRQKIGFN